MSYKGTYIPGRADAYELSRSKIELFMNCPRCFYLDRRLKIPQPPGFPFNLNSAVDQLLKNEFDGYRARKEPHPYIIEAGLDAVPFQHPELERWRANFTGVRYLHPALNLLLFGAVDDLWQDRNTGELYVVDYKSTSKSAEITLDADWQMGYKRQMEIYQYLLRNNGFTVSDTGYFVYCNGIRDRERFDARLDFDVKVIPYTGNDAWVEETLMGLHTLLNTNAVPEYSGDCAYCQYQKAVRGER